jgi:nucleotide-binding universal stress UspA family protein
MGTTVQQPKTRASTRSFEMAQRAKAAPLLVATDASEAADAALRAAHAIAEHTGQQVLVVAVHVPVPMAVPEVVVAESPGMEAERRGYLRSQVRDQMERVGLDKEWPLEVATGNPAAIITTLAGNVGASLVIMGLGEHGLFERLLEDETVLKVLRLGTVPVLAVAPGFAALPVNVLAAMDFSASSARAVSLAADLMSPDGLLTLAHVLAPDLDAGNWLTSNSAYHGTVGRAFDLLTADLGRRRVARIERKVLAGDPRKALSDYSKRILPDLIVAGSHGYGFLSRLLLGSVSQHLVRTAHCSLLIAPPEAGPGYLDELPQVTTRFESYAWAERLEEFTRRNAGRQATIEVIDPDLGAQIEEKGLPFVGVSFDPRDGRVQIMLGDDAADGRHLTRTIGGTTAIQVLRDRPGRDILLRVAHGRGQTLLTLER